MAIWRDMELLQGRELRVFVCRQTYNILHRRHLEIVSSWKHFTLAKHFAERSIMAKKEIRIRCFCIMHRSDWSRLIRRIRHISCKTKFYIRGMVTFFAKHSKMTMQILNWQFHPVWRRLRMVPFIVIVSLGRLKWRGVLKELESRPLLALMSVVFMWKVG